MKNLDMQKHLFLTGKRGIGKSTIISWVISQISVKISGFKTVYIPELNGDSNLYLLDADNGLNMCIGDYNKIAHKSPKTKIEIYPDKFISVGIPLLQKSLNSKLIIMDELGWIESSCTEFQNSVLSILNNDVPVIGVIRDTHTPFLDTIRGHPNVSILNVTTQNREYLREKVLQHIQDNTK